MLFSIEKEDVFLYEHLATATSWKIAEVQKVARMERVQVVKMNMCVFNMSATDGRARHRPREEEHTHDDQLPGSREKDQSQMHQLQGSKR